MLITRSSFALLFCLSLILALAFADTQKCGEKIVRYVNSSSALLVLVESAHQSLNCSVITIVPKTFPLLKVVTFKYLFNLSIVGEQEGTSVSCGPNSGFKFVDSELILLENLVFKGCSMNQTLQHSHLSKYPYHDLAAVYVYRSTNITVVNCHFEKSPGTGFILYEVTGNITIKSSNFSDNKPTSVPSNFTYGGMIICRNQRKEKATYTIHNCHFERNVNSIPELGGGVTVHLDAADSTSLVSITSSTFVRNEAKHGGGLFLNQASNSTNVVNVSNTGFVSNTANSQGGGIWITNWAESGAGSSPFVLNLNYCIFTLNFAEWGGGLSSYVDKGRVKISAQGTNWTRNGASTSGFAVGLEEHRSSNMTFSIEATLIDCWIYNNTQREFNASGGAVGALFVYGSRLVLKGETEISNNFGSALYLLESAHVTLGGGYLVFSKNEAARGAAIHMQSNSVLHLASSGEAIMILFSFNSAMIEGGAIYAELTESDPCLFDILTSAPFKPVIKPETHVWFVDNYADNYKQKGQSIFIRGYEPHSCFDEESDKWTTLLSSSPFYYEPNSSNSILFDVDKVHLNSSPPLNRTSDTLTVMLGEKFFLMPTITDKLNHTTTGIAHIVVTYADPDLNWDVNPNNSKFTYIGPNVMGLDNYTKNNELAIQGTDVTYDLILNNTIDDLVLQIIFEKNEAGYRDGYAVITIKLVPCRLGFIYDQDKGICECFSNSDHVLCPNTSSACVRNGYWFGRLGDNTSVYLLCDKRWCKYVDQKCPTEQCLTAPGFCALHDDENDLCFHGRGGIMCSRCKEKYAFTFASYRCVSEETCSAGNTVLVLLGVFVYWLLMILLLFTVLSMNLSIGTGFASGIVYYFSVVFLLTDTLVTSESLKVILYICTAVTQLDASLFGGIPVCFAKSWTYNMYHHAFRYASPVFVVVMILAIIWFSRYCNCPKRISLAENSPNHAICLLILVSYTSMTYTSFWILRPIMIDGGIFAYSDPDVPYFHPSKHLPFALVAIFVEVFFSLPICFLLLLAPCLSRIRGVNLVKLRLKPIVDEFQACYKDEHRWFAGFYFLARQMMYITYIIPHQVLPQSNSLLHCVCVFVLLVQTTVRPYKQQFWYLNIIDTLLLTDVLLLALFPINSYLNYSSNLPWLIRTIQMVSPYVLILLPSLYISGVIAFLVAKRFLRWCKKASHESAIDVATDTETTAKDSKPELCTSASFFKDYGEREPLLNETSSDCGSTYSSVGDEHHSTRSGFTTSSLRVENLRRFPPAAQHNDKAATS